MGQRSFSVQQGWCQTKCSTDPCSKGDLLTNALAGGLCKRGVRSQLVKDAVPNAVGAFFVFNQTINDF